MKRNEIEQLLPSVLRRAAYPGSPLVALLDAMEALHAPSEDVLVNVPSILNPYQAPDHLLPYLAQWVDLGRFLTEAPALGLQNRAPLSGAAPAPAPIPVVGDVFPPGLGRLRELISNATTLWQWRGTRRGLLGLLETATGIKGFTIDEDAPDANGRARPFHLRVRAPAEAQAFQRLVEQILEMEKPAYATYELQFGA